MVVLSTRVSYTTQLSGSTFHSGELYNTTEWWYFHSRELYNTTELTHELSDVGKIVSYEWAGTVLRITNNRAQRKAHKYQVKEQRKTTNWANRNKRVHSKLQQFHSEALALWAAWRRRWAVPVSLKARPYLALCIAFDFIFFVFRAFVLIFFLLRTCLRHRDQSTLAPTGVAFCEKEGKPWGFLHWIRTDVACVFIRE